MTAGRRPGSRSLAARGRSLAGSLQLTRPGYSVDEEFTVFAVRGIQAHGLPLLPSGLLYDRGIAYSYASLARRRRHRLRAAGISRDEPAQSRRSRVFLTFTIVRRLATETSRAARRVVLVALSMPFWATATSGRFYAPFLACYLAALLCPDAPRTGGLD